MIGVAVGSQNLKIVIPGQEDEEVSYNREGVGKVVETASGNGKCVVLGGNRRWAETLAYSLKEKGLEVRYLGRIEGGNQQKGNAGSLKKALENNFKGRLFFGNSQLRDKRVNGDEESDHPWLVLAHRYEKINDDIRRAKHRTLDALRLLFPELLALDSAKLWSKKRRAALQKPDWTVFKADGYDHQESLGQYVPADKQAEAVQVLKQSLFNLKEIEDKKEQLKEEITAVIADHPVVKAYNSSFSAMMLVLLIGWRSWGTTKKKGWLPLRSYAGLAVNRVDANGKPRISRKRPLIRTVTYHLLKTSRGKDVVAVAMARRSLEKANRVKRIEYVLRDVWEILKEN